MSKIAIVQFSSYGDGLQAAHGICKNSELELVELSPQQGQALLIFRGPAKVLEGVLKDIRYEVILRSVSIQDDPRLFEYYLSLTLGQVDQFLVCVEGGFLGDLFAAAEMALLLGMQIVELRPSKNLQGAGYLLVTSSQKSLADSFQNAVRTMQVKVNLISVESLTFKNYMNQP